jgi:hypothetical protein
MIFSSSGAGRRWCFTLPGTSSCYGLGIGKCEVDPFSFLELAINVKLTLLAKEMLSWLHRFFSLPYDLALHAQNQTQSMTASLIVITRKPIPIADAHK